jgi:alpha-amylase
MISNYIMLQSHLALTIFAILLTHYQTNAASLDDWRGRTIYQVLTDRFARTKDSKAGCDVVHGMYCGGTWKGIERKLDYIQGMNFDAIWISPIVEQLPQTTGWGEAYTGYWAQNLYALNDNFGSANDLKSLVKAVHDRGMYLMLDIVVNHMG